MQEFLEIWLRGVSNRLLKSLSQEATENYHPHITLLRPFDIRINPDIVKDMIYLGCSGVKPIFFTLEGRSSFDTGELFVPVGDASGLLEFSDGLERVLAPHVDLLPKPATKTRLHATLKSKAPMGYCSRISEYMLRMTAISRENPDSPKKIWFSYDFVRDELLNRETSLDESYWAETVDIFCQTYGLSTSPFGYKSKIKTM